MLFSFIAGKVRDLYFSLATLAIQIIFFSVVYNWISLTNGPYGIAGISSPEIFGLKINTPGSFALFGGFWVLCIILFYRWFFKTPLCRMIQATRDVGAYAPAADTSPQLGLFTPAQPSAAERALEEIDPDALTPREALEVLYRLKRLD